MTTALRKVDVHEHGHVTKMTSFDIFFDSSDVLETKKFDFFFCCCGH